VVKTDGSSCSDTALLLLLLCRLGAAWDEKKSICNKFLQGSPVTSLAWPQDHHNEVVFGVAEGKVKLGMLKTNKTYTLYSHPDNSYVVSLAPSLDGSALLSGHLDGSVYKCTLPKQEGGQGPGSSKLLQHHCVPHAIAWGQSILIAGNSCKVGAWSCRTTRQQQQRFSSSGSNAAGLPAGVLQCTACWCTMLAKFTHHACPAPGAPTATAAAVAGGVL
jgi:intraflagellar transport protein 172